MLAMSVSRVVVLGVLLGATSVADAMEIDFEQFPARTEINTQYADQGVALFSCPSGDPAIFGDIGVPAPVTGQGLLGFRFGGSGPVEVIRADFVSPVSDVSIAAGDVNPDQDDAFLEAYDHNGVLLDSAEVLLAGKGAVSLAVSSAAPIAYVIFGADGGINENSLIWDNLEFTLAPECYLVIGDGPGHATFLELDHLFETQLGPTIDDSYAVLLDAIPEFVLPAPGHAAVPIGLAFGGGAAVPVSDVPSWMWDGRFTVQVLMWNPSVFPEQPEQCSYGLGVHVQLDGSVTTQPFGTSVGGLEIWHELSTNALGQPVIRFPFSIPGL
jgi:hypothetical protein